MASPSFPVDGSQHLESHHAELASWLAVLADRPWRQSCPPGGAGRGKLICMMATILTYTPGTELGASGVPRTSLYSARAVTDLHPLWIGVGGEGVIHSSQWITLTEPFPVLRLFCG